jgi:Flp pilus assembly CpaF family ATPase
MQTAVPTSESQARRTNGLASALSPIAKFLADHRVVEVRGNADDAVWVDRLCEGARCTGLRVAASEVEGMLCLLAPALELWTRDHGRLRFRAFPMGEFR